MASITVGGKFGSKKGLFGWWNRVSFLVEKSNFGVEVGEFESGEGQV